MPNSYIQCYNCGGQITAHNQSLAWIRCPECHRKNDLAIAELRGLIHTEPWQEEGTRLFAKRRRTILRVRQ